MKLDSKKIKKYLATRKPEFKLFSMNYTDSEKDVINNFILEETKLFSHYGSIEMINDSLEKFLSSIGTNTSRNIKKMGKLIINMIKKVLKGYNRTHFWMDIRVFQPDNDPFVPRWHKDGNILESSVRTEKFITVLKGPGTLLIQSTKKVNDIFNKLFDKARNETGPTSTHEQRMKINKKYQLIYAKKFANEKIIQVKNSQGLVFIAGMPLDNSALHSEPKIDQPRMFISIVPGSKESIEIVEKKWNR